MNLRAQFFILGCILFLIIFTSVMAGSDPVPYSENTLFKKEFPYEGFDQGIPQEVIEQIKSQMDPQMSQEQMSHPPKAKETMQEAVKTEGFESLTPSPNNVNDSTNDIFSQASSGKGCAPSPYSNSQGYLCLDPNAINMLSTRGGNATGKSSQIGY